MDLAQHFEEKEEDRVIADTAPICSVTVGDILVTFLPDGIHRVQPLAEYPGSTSELWTSHRQLLDADGWLVMSLGSFLVESMERKFLVDAGMGPRKFDNVDLAGGQHKGDISGGCMLDNLAATGTSPEDIDGILFSHLHLDHVGWLCSTKGERRHPTFKNADYYVSAAEWNYWTGKKATNLGAPGADEIAIIKERLVHIGDGYSPVQGITVVSTPGHTRGHCSFMVWSGTERVLILGDAVHNPIEFECPDLEFAFEHDLTLAMQSRKRIWDLVDNPSTIIAGGHFANRVFGRLGLPDSSGTRMLSFLDDQVVGNDGHSSIRPSTGGSS